MPNRAAGNQLHNQPNSQAALYSLYAANAISMTGNQLALLAIPWFVLATTGSAAQTGITAFFTLLPTVISTFFGGTLVDRMGFKQARAITKSSPCIPSSSHSMLKFPHDQLS